MNSNPILSIYVPTYNHEKYIVQALDSILMQKTQYPFEVLVGEDASTDSTRAILQAYEKQHPGFLTVFYRKENMNLLPVGNSMDLKMRCRGKYLICLEGDDYWTDPQKLDRQIRFLETHPDCVGVSHNCIVVDENSVPNGEDYPQCKETEYTIHDYYQGVLPGQTATIMWRNYMLCDRIDKSLLLKDLTPGDRIIVLTMLTQGKIHCIQETMSAYRHVVHSGCSFSANQRFNYKREQNWYRCVADYVAKHFPAKYAAEAEYQYVGIVWHGLHTKKIPFLRGVRDLWKASHKMRVFGLTIRRKLLKK